MHDVEFHIFNNSSYVDLYPIQFGIEKCKPLHSFGPTKKQNYLFHYIISGKGTFFDTEKQIKHMLSAGQGFLIPPNTICSYEADKNEPWTYTWMEVSGLKAEYFFSKAGLFSKNLILKQILPPTENDIYREMMYIIKNHQKNSINIIAHLFLFFDALISLSSYQNNLSSGVNTLYIEEAIHFIEQNYASNITIEDIALHCNLNRHYFSRLFKEKMNTSPQQFLIQYRLIKSCDLLKNTNYSIAYISEQVGYSNQFNFSYSFKKFFNQSPSEWKKHYFKKNKIILS